MWQSNPGIRFCFSQKVGIVSSLEVPEAQETVCGQGLDGNADAFACMGCHGFLRWKGHEGPANRGEPDRNGLTPVRAWSEPVGPLEGPVEGFLGSKIPVLRQLQYPSVRVPQCDGGRAQAALSEVGTQRKSKNAVELSGAIPS